MDSEYSTDEEEQEAYLYSLIHHSGEFLEEEGLQSEIISTNENIESEVNVSTPLYHSKYSKVSRWDVVKSIINSAEGLTDTDNREFSSQSRNLNNNFRIRKDVIENNYSSFLNTKKFRTPFTQRIPNKRLNFQTSTPNHKYDYKGRTSTSSSLSLEQDQTKSKNSETLVQNSGSFVQDIYFLNNVRNCDTSVSENVDTLNYPREQIEHYEGNISKNVSSNEREQLSNEIISNRNSSTSPKKNTCIQIEKTDGSKKTSTNSKHKYSGDESTLSKYDLVLNNNKQNLNDETIVVLDSSDSDHDSVTVVDPPVKEPPPVVLLSSDEEMVNKSLVEEVIKESSDDDIVVLYTVNNNKQNMNLDDGSMGSMCGKTKQKKAKKRNKRKNSRPKKVKHMDNYSKSLNSLSEIYDFISPSSWTKSMRDFYNNSWGGEKFSIEKLKQRMSGNRSKWHVSYDDLFSTPVWTGPDRHFKCNNCNFWGHLARNCPQPKKPDVCLFCGTIGHLSFNCPKPICLHCGKPSTGYNAGCSSCSSSKQTCTICKDNEHPTSLCPESWRKYHAVTSRTCDTSADNLRMPHKPQNEQFCCNCTKKGHEARDCKKPTSSSASHKSLKRRGSPRAYFKIPEKRRKFNRNSSNFLPNYFF